MATKAEKEERAWKEATANDILACLMKKHEIEEADRWIFATELSTSTGMDAKQRLDAWAMSVWPSRNFTRITYEVKVSRGDFLKEIKTPQKRKLGLVYSNYFYFVTPPGLVSVAEVPQECGLIEYNRDGRPYTKVSAPFRDSMYPTWGFMAAVQRAITKGAVARATRELDWYRHQKDASLETKIQSAYDAQERLRLAGERNRDDEYEIYNDRDDLNRLRKEMGLEPIDWRARERARDNGQAAAARYSAAGGYPRR